MNGIGKTIKPGLVQENNRKVYGCTIPTER